MKKVINVCMAIQYLPEELVTPEIAKAGIEEGDLNLLSYLPQKYLSVEVIKRIIGKNERGYYRNFFKLSNIPAQYRFQQICDFSVNNDIDNFPDVPPERRNQFMLGLLIQKLTASIKYLHLIPATLWNTELAYIGINKAYINTCVIHSQRGVYRSYEANDIKLVQVFLTFVPKTIKTKQFYFGLFSNTQLSPKNIDIIVPSRFKNRSYYLRMAKQDFSLIPKNHYCYEIFMEAVAKNSKTSVSNLLSKITKPHLYEYMDDAMADSIVTKEAEHFKDLPFQFQTSQRLVLAIDSYSGSYHYIFPNESYKHLFTESVCQAFVRTNKQCPKFPDKIWTPDFINYCMRYGTSFYWFDQFPKHLQTREIVDQALNHNEANITYANRRFISLERAKAIHRSSPYWRNDIPRHFYNDFIQQTGLPQDFFGGEVGFWNLREIKENYTFCKLGDCYLGFYRTEMYKRTASLIMTRHIPNSGQPEVIFDREIGTFHTTWLEKMINDNDPAFKKPVIEKRLKLYQVNSYYTVQEIETYKSYPIYGNKLLDEIIGYTVKIDNSMRFYTEIKKLKKVIDDKEQPTTKNQSQHPNLQ